MNIKNKVEICSEIELEDYLNAGWEVLCITPNQNPQPYFFCLMKIEIPGE
uniref:DUF4177 domain-containing protein n=1 Tax=viral metagenome TaxID=1070528 RepID=A0A6M3LFU7_9ZZZZ